MNYLYKKNNKFPLKVEEFKKENYENYFFRLIKDFLKTLLFNFSKKNFFPNYSNFAVNNEGVLEQDYFKDSKRWTNIISTERLKINYKKKISKQELRIKIIHKIIQYSKEILKIDIPKFIQEDFKYRYEYYQNLFSLLIVIRK